MHLDALRWRVTMEHLPQVESDAFTRCRSDLVFLNNQIGADLKEGTNAAEIVNRQDQRISPSSLRPADATRLRPGPQPLWEQTEYQSFNQRHPDARQSRRMLVLLQAEEILSVTKVNTWLLKKEKQLFFREVH